MEQRTNKLSYAKLYQGHHKGGHRKYESIITKHDRYLIELEKQKKLAKNMHQEDPTAKEREKKEQGFSLYVNGANAESKKSKSIPSAGNLASCRPKSTTSLPKRGCNSPKAKRVIPRLNTAPESQRKYWGQASIEIATNTGEKLYASVRGMDHNYSDDFDESTDFESIPENIIVKNCENASNKSRIPEPLTRRKYWGQGPVVVKASSGESLRASVSKMNNLEYSMNFEECSDDSSTDSDVEIDEVIETSLVKPSSKSFSHQDAPLIVLGKPPFS